MESIEFNNSFYDFATTTLNNFIVNKHDELNPQIVLSLHG